MAQLSISTHGDSDTPQPDEHPSSDQQVDSSDARRSSIVPRSPHASPSVAEGFAPMETTKDDVPNGVPSGVPNGAPNGVPTIEEPESSSDNGTDQAQAPGAGDKEESSKGLTTPLPNEDKMDPVPSTKPEPSNASQSSESDTEDDSDYSDSYEAKFARLQSKANGWKRIRDFGRFLRAMEERMKALESSVVEIDKSQKADKKKPQDALLPRDTAAPTDETEASKSGATESTDETEASKNGTIDPGDETEASKNGTTDPGDEIEASKKPICDLQMGDEKFFDREKIADDAADTFQPSKAGGKPLFPPTWVIEVLLSSETAMSVKTHEDAETKMVTHKRPERIRIRSTVLLNYLSTMGGFDSDCEKLIFLSPFKLFTKKQDQIREKLTSLRLAHKSDVVTDKHSEVPSTLSDDENKDAVLLTHLELLIELFDTTLAPTLKLYTSLLQKTATHISFDNLYYLFDYGVVVYCATEPEQLFRVYGYSGGRRPLETKQTDGPKVTFVLDCYHYGRNGKSYGPVARRFTISEFPGSREISSLSVYPLDFHPNAKSVRQHFLDRARQYIMLNAPDEVVHRQYTAAGVNLDGSQEEIDSPVIIDQKLARQHNTGRITDPDFGIHDMTTHDDLECSRRCECSPSCSARIYSDFHQDYNNDKEQTASYFTKMKHVLQPPEDLHVDGPPEEDEILLPYFVFGFVLRSRRWVKLRVSMIDEIEYKSSFEKLVLPRGHTKTIKALVQDHSRGPKFGKDSKEVEISMDLVKGKGKGLIILLHGAPGVGKTSTAECIADFTKRPLYPITCGDIGSVAEQVEENLEKAFQLAHKWGCVLLLDEADVFLKERDRKDIQRNAIVSVFLRSMEYYSGILFLTTNRVGTIDPAFRSRIHLSLYYPPLNEDATVKIWDMHLVAAKQLFEGKQIIELEEDEIIRYAKDLYRRLERKKYTVWNGRQIRNAFQTAIALAKMETKESGGSKIVLKSDHFQKVAKMSEEFDKYLLQTQGGSEGNLAKMFKIRDDEYKDEYASDDRRSRNKQKSSRMRDVSSRSVTPARRRGASPGRSDTEGSPSDSGFEERKRRNDRPKRPSKSKSKPKDDRSDAESSGAERRRKEKDRRKKRRDDSE